MLASSMKYIILFSVSLLLSAIFSQEEPELFDSTDSAFKWASENIGKKLINNTFQSKSSEAMVIWQDSDLTGNNIKVLTICKPLGSVKWNFVRIDVLDDYKYDDINYDNFGIAEYDIAQDYLGYYTKNNKILIFGLAIDEASGMAKKR